MPQTRSLYHARLTSVDRVLADPEEIGASSLRHFKATDPFFLRGRRVDSPSLHGGSHVIPLAQRRFQRIRCPGVSGTSLNARVILATPFALVSGSGISLRILSGAKCHGYPVILSTLNSCSCSRSIGKGSLQQRASCLLTNVKGMHASEIALRVSRWAFDLLEPVFAWQGEQSLQALQVAVLIKNGR